MKNNTKNETGKEWGIDIEGRIMWYEPWPVNTDGSYRMPDEKKNMKFTEFQEKL